MWMLNGIYASHHIYIFFELRIFVKIHDYKNSHNFTNPKQNFEVKFLKCQLFTEALIIARMTILPVVFSAVDR